MAESTNKVALQALQEYLLDVKPYHVKLKEVQADYVFNDVMDVTFLNDKLFTHVYMQNVWNKNSVGGWRLTNVSDGTAGSKKYRIPSTIIPRFTSDTFQDQTPHGRNFAFTTQLGTDQVPYIIPWSKTFLTFGSYTNVGGNAKT